MALPVRYSVPGDQLLVLSDFKLPKDHELIRELNGLREQVTTILDLPVKRDPVVVYLFNNETEYRRYMNATYPRLPPRSAYFVGTTTELAVYTHWGQNVREDLRHEYTHGLLHSGLKRVPLWLDEGLAEYFEVAGPKPGGLNHDYAEHLAGAIGSGWRPDMKRLENLDDSAQMKRADYQESWAWVHFLLNSTPEAKSLSSAIWRNCERIRIPRRSAIACEPPFQSTTRGLSVTSRSFDRRQRRWAPSRQSHPNSPARTICEAGVSMRIL